MAKVPIPTPRRIICYHQTHHRSGKFISALPLLTEKTGVTHVIIAAVHIHSPPKLGCIYLNDDPFDAPRNDPLWAEVRTFQSNGVKVLGMLGGAAQGSFMKLDGTHARFDEYYQHLKAMITKTGLNGLDLDVEEAMSFGGIIRLIDHLKHDFGREFLITLAPVAPAMSNLQNLSGFNYEELEKGLGARVAWYNVQFYCGWGDMSRTAGYEDIVRRGWPPEKIVVGLITNPRNGDGWVEDEPLKKTLTKLIRTYPKFGGVMGWEYFNSLTSTHGEGKPWLWAAMIRDIFTSADVPTDSDM